MVGVAGPAGVCVFMVLGKSTDLPGSTTTSPLISHTCLPACSMSGQHILVVEAVDATRVSLGECIRTLQNTIAAQALAEPQAEPVVIGVFCVYNRKCAKEDSIPEDLLKNRCAEEGWQGARSSAVQVLFASISPHCTSNIIYIDDIISAYE